MQRMSFPSDLALFSKPQKYTEELLAIVYLPVLSLIPVSV